MRDADGPFRAFMLLSDFRLDRSWSRSSETMDSGGQALWRQEDTDAGLMSRPLNEAGPVRTPDPEPPAFLLRPEADQPVAETNRYWSQAIGNDSLYINGSLWGVYSADSPAAVGPSGTTSLYGTQAEAAWNAGFTGSRSVVVGIVDEGFQITHPDLKNNVWTNPGEIAGDGLDNDGNGYVDDLNGWDFANNDRTVYDAGADAHGTHLAGIIGAEGGNGIGVAGVNWAVSMVSGKFLGANGSGTLAGAIAAINYMTALKQAYLANPARGANIAVINNSWTGTGYSADLHTAILRAAKAGILVVCAAGNGGSDLVGDNNDTTPIYPANYSTLLGTTAESSAGYEAVISVAALRSDGSLAPFSNYGAQTVDLAAPGSGILSTAPTTDLVSGSYASRDGTSQAAAFVSGAIALYASRYPTATAAQIRAALLQSATATPTASLTGRTVTGGRLDVNALLATAPPVLPANQTLWGTTGSDAITGGDGNDQIAGVPATGSNPGRGSIDQLTGGAGSDTFLLGDSRGVFYDDGSRQSNGKQDYALIQDFTDGQDFLQLRTGSYWLRSETQIGGTTSGVAIYIDNGSTNGSWDSRDDYIAFVRGVTTAQLTGADIRFV